MSISALSAILTVGVVSGRNVGHQGDGDAGADDGPIELPEARRICASLCISGLGGKPCGENCLAIQPTDFQAQSQENRSQEVHIGTTPFPRRDACPLLCQYELGDPLCDCPPQFSTFDSIFFKIDFDRICGFFCLRHNYQIYGCQSCDAYREEEEAAASPSPYAIIRWPRKEIDWDAWCREKCAVGDGGVACNCDILPLSLPIKPQPGATKTKE